MYHIIRLMVTVVELWTIWVFFFFCRIYVKVRFLVQPRTPRTPEYVFGLLSSEVWSRSALILPEQDMFSQLRERERERERATLYVDRSKGQVSPVMAVHLACEQKSVPHGSLQTFHTIRRVTGKSFCD